MRGEAVMEEATSIKALISSLWWCVCYVCVSADTLQLHAASEPPALNADM